MGESRSLSDQDVLECIRQLLAENPENASDLNSHTPLSRYLDSFHLIQFVVALEDVFDVSFSQAELLDERNWKDAFSVVRLIEAKRSSNAA